MGSGPLVILAGHSYCKFERRLESWLGSRLRDVCAYDVPGAYFSPLSKKRDQWGEKIWDGKVSLFDRTKRTFPTGLLPRVANALEKERVPYLIESVPRASPVDHDFVMLSAWELRDYQRDSVAECLRLKRCMVQVATGGGKTIIAGGITEAVGHQTLFLVHTKDLLTQAIDMFSDMFGADQVGQVGDGIIRIAPITVATVQTMARVVGQKYEAGDEDDVWQDKTKITAGMKAALLQWLDGVGVVFMDECHRVAAPSAEGVVAAIKNAPYKIGLSASPWRDDGMDIVLEGTFGGVGPTVSASQLIDQGFLVPPVIRMLAVPPEIYDRDEMGYAEIYDDYIVENDVRNIMGIRATISMVRRGRPTLVLVRRLIHGRAIADRLSNLLGFGVPFLSGEDDGLVRKNALGDIRDERLGCVM
jgi:superfamily II DNA or RNA helicase